MTEPLFELSRLPAVTTHKQKLSDSVYDVLCEYIVTGQLRPSQRLREARVAAALEVSRTPVREAFAKLEAQHLLERDSTGGYLVASWDKTVLWEVATLRAALEGLAITLACTRLTPADFDYLQSIILQMDGAYQRGDYDRLINLDITFHSYIWAHTGHTLLTHQLEEMKAQVRYFMYLTLPGDEKDYAASHQELLDVLREANVEKAVSAIREHTHTTAERAIHRLKREEVPAKSSEI
jgi:DNA-binding GntR family transcriptional regulator